MEKNHIMDNNRVNEHRARQHFRKNKSNSL